MIRLCGTPTETFEDYVVRLEDELAHEECTYLIDEKFDDCKSCLGYREGCEHYIPEGMIVLLEPTFPGGD